VGGVDYGEDKVKNRLTASRVSRSAPHYDELTINLLIASSRLINHNTRATVTHVPLRRHILIPGAEVLGVGRAGRRAGAPDCGIAGMERPVGDDRDGLAQLIDGDIPPAGIDKVLVRCAMGDRVHRPVVSVC
jgi:hypothetical protein